MDNRRTEPEAELCPNCMKPNLPGHDFCQHCHAPLTPHAWTDPLLGVSAEGFALQKIVNERMKPIVLIVMWLWMAPIIVFVGYLIFITACEFITKGDVGQWPAYLLGFTFEGGMFVLIAAILRKATRNYFRQRAKRNGRDFSG